MRSSGFYFQFLLHALFSWFDHIIGGSRWSSRFSHHHLLMHADRIQFLISWCGFRGASSIPSRREGNNWSVCGGGADYGIYEMCGWENGEVWGLCVLGLWARAAGCKRGLVTERRGDSQSVGGQRARPVAHPPKPVSEVSTSGRWADRVAKCCNVSEIQN